MKSDMEWFDDIKSLPKHEIYINFENSNMAIAAGIDILVSGTTIFKENGGNLKKNIQLLKTG